VIELRTARLLLRPHGVDDVDDAVRMWSDPAVVLHIGGRPFTAEETWARVCRYAGQWQLLGYGYFAVRELGSHAFVGDVGLADFRRAIEPPLDAPELGYALTSSSHGKGYATEAVGAVLAWADARFAKTVCIIDPPNTASRRVAEKHGYVEERRAVFHGGDVVIMARPRPATAG
jgi:RimJ/RimL family protein N-acetyltransferase